MADEQEKSEKPAEEQPVIGGEIISESLKEDRALSVPQAQEPAQPFSVESGKGVSPDDAVITKINPDSAESFFCQTCGKGPWTTAKARDMHVRAAHTNRGGRPSKPKVDKSREQANGEPLPAPDFSDIDGGASRPLPPQQAADPGIRYETMAAMSFDMTTGVLARIFGPEWNPSSADERAAVVLAIKRYYESVQLPDIPPGYMLCFVCMAYAAPRLGQQPTRTKLQAAWIWLKMKFTRSRKGLENRQVVQQK